MYTVNITFKVPHDLLDIWKLWMHDEWQPKAVTSCAASAFQLHRLLNHDDEHGAIMVFQLSLLSGSLLNNFLENKENELHQQIRNKWGNEVVFFQTILEKIDSATYTESEN